MNERLRNTLIGLGVGVAVGAVVFFLTDEELQEQTRGGVNRLRAKRFVKHHLNGSDRALTVVDNMDTHEINKLLDTVDRFEELQESFSGYRHDTKEAAMKVKDQVVDYVQNVF